MISVVICTRNRSKSLRRTLESMAQLSPPERMSWEIVVVDNGSTDETKGTVLSFIETTTLDIRYIFEPNNGKCYALNTGMREARGEIIACTDDDVLVDKEWLVNIATECLMDSCAGMYFGQTRVARPGLPKLSIREGNSSVTYQFPCNPAEPGPSNNMVVRKAIFSLIGGFDTTLGPGTKLRAADDTDFTYRALRSGAVVKYCPKVLAYHDHDRLSSAANRSLLFAYGIGRGGFYCKHIIQRDRWALKLCYWELKWALRLLFQNGNAIRGLLHLAGLFRGFAVRLIQELGHWRTRSNTRAASGPVEA